MCSTPQWASSIQQDWSLRNPITCREVKTTTYMDQTWMANPTQTAHSNDNKMNTGGTLIKSFPTTEGWTCNRFWFWTTYKRDRMQSLIQRSNSSILTSYSTWIVKTIQELLYTHNIMEIPGVVGTSASRGGNN